MTKKSNAERWTGYDRIRTPGGVHRYTDADGFECVAYDFIERDAKGGVTHTRKTEFAADYDGRVLKAQGKSTRGGRATRSMRATAPVTLNWGK